MNLLYFLMGDQAAGGSNLGSQIRSVDDTSWQERCDHWLNSSTKQRRPGRARRHINEPLVLTGHGMRLCVDNGALVIRNGFTYYPQALDERRYFPGDRKRPSRIIVVDGSGSLTFDVMTWLAEQKIPLIRIDWRGNVITVLSESYGLNPKRVKRQLDALASGQAVPIATSLIQQKFENSIMTLKALPQSGARDRAIRSTIRNWMNWHVGRREQSMGCLVSREERRSRISARGNHCRCNERVLAVGPFQMTGVRSARAPLARTVLAQIAMQRIQSTRF